MLSGSRSNHLGPGTWDLGPKASTSYMYQTSASAAPDTSIFLHKTYIYIPMSTTATLVARRALSNAAAAAIAMSSGSKAVPLPYQKTIGASIRRHNAQQTSYYGSLSSFLDRANLVNFMSSMTNAGSGEDKNNEKDDKQHQSKLHEYGVTNSKVRDTSNYNTEAGRRRNKSGRRRRRGGDFLGSRAHARGGVRIIYEPPRRVIKVKPENEISDRIRVKAVHAAATIDIVSVLGKVFGGATSSASTLGELGIGAPTRHVFGKNGTSILFQLPPPDVSNILGQLKDFDPSPRFVAVFKFGSVVFHNITTQESGRILSEIKKHSSDPVTSGFEKREAFEIAVQPDLPEATGEVTSEFATVKELEIHSVAVISKIMAQTVALDSYSDTVDELLSAFATINTSVKNTGTFSPMDKETLFKVVAQNNSLMMNMIGKLGIKDRSDIAWELSEYDNVYEGMKQEFELEPRFETIEYKLNTIQTNAKFFLEMLAHQKSTSLEWIIVVLIAFESALMILEMSGQGEKVFSFIAW